MLLAVAPLQGVMAVPDAGEPDCHDGGTQAAMALDNMSTHSMHGADGMAAESCCSEDAVQYRHTKERYKANRTRH